MADIKVMFFGAVIFIALVVMIVFIMKRRKQAKSTVDQSVPGMFDQQPQKPIYKEEKTMEPIQEQPIEGQLIKGAWDNIQVGERKPRITWANINDSHTVTFADNFVQPLEIPYKQGVFYVFDVRENGEELSITTSAWSLLRGLKEHMPLAGKILNITKRMKDGKQAYEVLDVNDVQEETIV